MHGCYSILIEKLNRIKFNYSNDRLICTGDLVDRGTESLECLNLLSEPWFFSCIGNHDYYAYLLMGKSSLINISNMNKWVLSLSNKDKEYYKESIKNQLHLSITILDEFHLPAIGCFHSSVPFKGNSPLDKIYPADWSYISNIDESDLIYQLNERSWYSEPISSIPLVVHGHTTIQSFYGDSYVGATDLRNYNSIYIDLGIVFTDKVHLFLFDNNDLTLV